MRFDAILRNSYFFSLDTSFNNMKNQNKDYISMTLGQVYLKDRIIFSIIPELDIKL